MLPASTRSPIRILVVEDSKFFRKAVEAALINHLGAQVVVAESFAEAKKVMIAEREPFDFALIDLILPDSWEGEVVDHVLVHEIPCIVFTGVFSENFREKIAGKSIIDYLVKDSPTCIEALITLLTRLIKNKSTQALVVDDSKTSRQQISQLLKLRQFQVCEAKDGATALEMLERNPNIRLVITDYLMPGMNGVEMVKAIRQKHSAQRLAIIGLSSAATASLSAQFIKYGANDFLAKNFLPEEFFCRVEQNMRMIELVEELQNAAVTDYLTGMHNRAYFFDTGTRLMASQSRGQITLTTAILDIDHFKQVNDTHGHAAGDLVLKTVGELLHKSIRNTDIVARLGGEEFAFMLVNMDEERCVSFFDALRQKIEKLEINYNGSQIPITCSIGITPTIENNLEATLAAADAMLYRAKKSGRNRVISNIENHVR